ncbi:hypothetical protein HK104_005153 [Borealophlyctis nickersoniae]|nr:hypothetical protein HK104_005153 [Borealophlyctis nickersoniae]
MDAVRATGVKEHFDLGAAKEVVESGGLATRPDYLVFRLTDLIRMAFSASTAGVDDLRLEGLGLLQDLLEKFADAADPDFDDHALLEQYQAQISAALTPAFAPDSTPEVMSVACRVCAVYVGSGINKELSTLSRVLKMLTGLLDLCKDTSSELAISSPHAHVMLKLAILSAWAELHVASFRHDYLKEVVGPNIPTLCDLWVTSLRDYAKLKLEADVMTKLGEAAPKASSGTGLDTYLAATREVVLPFYTKSWVLLLQSVSSLVDDHGDVVASVLRPDAASPDQEGGERVPKLFYVLFGLCVETASLGSGTVNVAKIPGLNREEGAAVAKKADPVAFRICLESLGKLCSAKVVGEAGLDQCIFIETMNILDRLFQTEDVATQNIIIRIVKQIVSDYGDEYLLMDDLGLASAPGSATFFSGSLDNIAAQPILPSPESAQPTPTGLNTKVYKIVKLLLNVFLYHVPGLTDNPAAAVTANKPSTPETVQLLSIALETLANFVSSPEIAAKYADNLVPIAMFVFTAILQSEKFATDIAPRVLVCIKKSIEGLETADGPSVHATDVIAKTLKSSLTTLLDAMEEREGDNFTASEDGGSDASAALLRNQMLAVVLIVTTCPVLSYHQESQDRLIETFSKAARSSNVQIALASLQCIRTLCLLSTRSDSGSSAVGTSYVRLLIPHVVIVALGIAGEAATPGTSAAARIPVLEDAVKLLLLLYTVVTGEKTSQTLLQLATTQQQHFKVAIAGMPDERRGQLERGLKSIVGLQTAGGGVSSGGGGGAAAAGDEEVVRHEAPKIQLKQFGSF